MKRLLAVLLAMVFVLGTVPMTYATEEVPSLEDFFNEIGGYPETLDINVDSDIALRESGSFVTGPVKVETRDASDPDFDFRATLYMEQVREAFKLYMTSGRFLAAGDVELLTRLANMKVTGEFTVTIEWPNELNVPESIYEEGNLVGFNDATSHVFGERSRVVTKGSDTTTMVITIDVVGPEKLGYVTASELEANLEEYFPDLTLTCSNITADDFGTYTIYGAVTGFTLISNPDGELRSTVNYDAVQKDNGDIGKATNEMAGTLIITERTGGGGNGNGNGGNNIIINPPSTNEVTLSFDYGVVEHYTAPVTKNAAFEYDLNTVEIPASDEFVFAGWHMDEACTQPAANPVVVDRDMTVYAKWINKKVPDVLNGDDHMAYVIGYPEGDVRPEANITRDEIATIFYRLFKDGKRDEIFTADNNYTDVPKSWWANKAVSSISKGGYMNGYEDGSFRPAEPITRAEFATVASRFYGAVETNSYFSDITGHWAEDNIKKAAAYGLINGYEDGTFRPDAYISRAEAMTIFNRILVRYVKDGGLCEGFVKWPDNPVDAWYYYEVVEATNTHTFDRLADGYHEQWTAVLDNWVWAEKAKYEDPDQ